MAIGRSRYAPPYTSSTKGHSVLKQRSYAMPTRNPPAANVSRAAAYDTRAEEYLLADRVNNVNYLSNTLMDEGYDTALKSRGRDQQLLKEATNAIVSSESYATPQTSVASRRVARGQSVATRAASVPPRPLKPEVVDTSISTTTAATLSQAPPSPRAKRPIVLLPPQGAGRAMDRATSVPPVVVFREDKGKKVPLLPRFTREERRSKAKARSVPPAVVLPPPPRRSQYRAPDKRLAPVQPVREPLPTAALKAHKVPRRFLTRTAMRTGFSSLHGYHEPESVGGHTDEGMRKSVNKARVLASPVARSRGSSALLYTPPRPKPAPMRESLRDFPKVFVPYKGQGPSNRSKAAIIASKLEPDPVKRRRPRSEFAANKYRELRKEALESSTGAQGSGQGSSNGVEGGTRPVSELRRRLRRTLNKSRVS